MSDKSLMSDFLPAAAWQVPAAVWQVPAAARQVLASAWQSAGSSRQAAGSLPAAARVEAATAGGCRGRKTAKVKKAPPLIISIPPNTASP